MVIFPVTTIFRPVRLMAPEPVTAKGPVMVMQLNVILVEAVIALALIAPRVRFELKFVIETTLPLSTATV